MHCVVRFGADGRAVRLCTAVALVLSSAALTRAQTPIETRRVQFAAGASSAEVKGQLKGEQIVDYVIRAAAGQTIAVTMKATNAANYFNVLPPGSNDAAMFNSSIGGDYKGMLPADGDYKVRIYLIRAAARRNETSTYTVAIGVTGKPLAPLPASQDALVKGTNFHATGQISCVVSFDPTPRRCDASVVRRGRDGTATLDVRGPNGFRRLILLVAGRPVASDAPQAATSDRKGDLTTIRFGDDERFEVPDALLVGG